MSVRQFFNQFSREVWMEAARRDLNADLASCDDASIDASTQFLMGVLTGTLNTFQNYSVARGDSLFPALQQVFSPFFHTIGNFGSSYVDAPPLAYPTEELADVLLYEFLFSADDVTGITDRVWKSIGAQDSRFTESNIALGCVNVVPVSSVFIFGQRGWWKKFRLAADNVPETALDYSYKPIQFGALGYYDTTNIETPKSSIAINESSEADENNASSMISIGVQTENDEGSSDGRPPLVCPSADVEVDINDGDVFEEIPADVIDGPGFASSASTSYWRYSNTIDNIRANASNSVDVGCQTVSIQRILLEQLRPCSDIVLQRLRKVCREIRGKHAAVKRFSDCWHLSDEDFLCAICLGDGEQVPRIDRMLERNTCSCTVKICRACVEESKRRVDADPDELAALSRCHCCRAPRPTLDGVAIDDMRALDEEVFGEEAFPVAKDLQPKLDLRSWSGGPRPISVADINESHFKEGDPVCVFVDPVAVSSHKNGVRVQLQFFRHARIFAVFDTFGETPADQIEANGVRFRHFPPREESHLEFCSCLSCSYSSELRLPSEEYNKKVYGIEFREKNMNKIQGLNPWSYSKRMLVSWMIVAAVPHQKQTDVLLTLDDMRRVITNKATPPHSRVTDSCPLVSFLLQDDVPVIKDPDVLKSTPKAVLKVLCAIFSPFLSSLGSFADSDTTEVREEFREQAKCLVIVKNETARVNVVQEVGKLLDEGHRNMCDVILMEHLPRDFPAKPTIFVVVTVNLEEKDRSKVVEAASMGRSTLRVTHL